MSARPNIRGDMPVAQPFDGRLQRSSQLAAVLLGHQHGQGIAPRSFQATTETAAANNAPPTIIASTLSFFMISLHGY
jgi:hypothetical protein